MEELLFNASQPSHTDVHAHLELCEQTVTARLRVSTETLANARLHVGNAQKTAFPRAALVIPLNQDAKVL